MSEIKVILRLSCGHGKESASAYLVTQSDWDDYTSDEGEKSLLEKVAWGEACEFAEMYGIYPQSEDSEDDEYEDDVIISDEISGWFELYSPKEHDGLMAHNQTSWKWRVIK